MTCSPVTNGRSGASTLRSRSLSTARSTDTGIAGHRQPGQLAIIDGDDLGHDRGRGRPGRDLIRAHRAHGHVGGPRHTVEPVEHPGAPPTGGRPAHREPRLGWVELAVRGDLSERVQLVGRRRRVGRRLTRVGPVLDTSDGDEGATEHREGDEGGCGAAFPAHLVAERGAGPTGVAEGEHGGRQHEPARDGDAGRRSVEGREPEQEDREEERGHQRRRHGTAGPGRARTLRRPSPRP